MAAAASNVELFNSKSTWNPSFVNLGTVFEGSSDFLSAVDAVKAYSGKQTFATSGFSYFGDGYSPTSTLLTANDIANPNKPKSLGMLLASAQNIEESFRANTGLQNIEFSPTIVLYSADASTGQQTAVHDMTGTGAITGLANLILLVSYLESRQASTSSGNSLGITTVINPDLIKTVDDSYLNYGLNDAIKDIDYNNILGQAIAKINSKLGDYPWLSGKTLSLPPAVAIGESKWQGWMGYNTAIGYICDTFAPSIAWSTMMNTYFHANMFEQQQWWVSADGKQASVVTGGNLDVATAVTNATNAFTKAGTFTNGYAPDFITFDKYEADDFSFRGGKPFLDAKNATQSKPNGNGQQSYYSGYTYENYIDFVRAISETVDGASRDNPMPVLLWQVPATHIPTTADYAGKESDLYQHIGYIGSDAAANEKSGRNVITGTPSIDSLSNQLYTPHILGFAGPYIFGDYNLTDESSIHPALSSFSLADDRKLGTSIALASWSGAKTASGSWVKGRKDTPTQWPSGTDLYALSLEDYLAGDAILASSSPYHGALATGDLPSQIRGIQFGGGFTSGLYNYRATMGSPDYSWAAQKATDYLTTSLNGSKGSSDADFLIGTSEDNMLIGEAGDDQIAGRQGDDKLFGGIGNDLVLGGKGNDLLVGGEGNDDIRAGSGSDTIHSGAGDDVASAGGGDDVIIGGDGRGNDRYDGGEGIDLLRYSSVKTSSLTIDLEAGSASGEEIGADILQNIENVTGGAASDFIIGSKGDNQINGGKGSDELTGLEGRDTFIFRSYDCAPYSIDHITDFNAAEDRIDVDNPTKAIDLRPLGSVSSLTERSINNFMTRFLQPNQALIFNMGPYWASPRTLLLVNNGRSGFQGDSDLLIELTGFSGNLNSTILV